MQNSRLKIKRLTAAIGTCLALGAAAPMWADTDLMVENDGLTLSAFVNSSSQDVLSMKIRIVGPNGFTHESRIENDQLQWIPEADLPDGNYAWEIRVITARPEAEIRSFPTPQQRVDSLPPAAAASITERGSERAPQVKLERYFRSDDLETKTINGDFSIRDGWMIDEPELGDELSQTRDPSNNPFFKAVGAVLDFLVPSAQAQNVEASGNVPLVIWDRDSTPANDYFFAAYVGALRLDMNDSSGISTTNAVRFYSSMPSGALSVRGDESTANNAQVGIGTSVPTEALHIDSRVPRIRIENSIRNESWFIRNINATFADSSRFEIGTDQTFTVGSTNVPTSPFAIEAPTSESEAQAQHNALYIDTFGRVGMGTDEPGNNLDIRGLLGSPFASIGLANQYSISAGTPLIGSKNFTIRESSTGNAVVRIAGGAPANSIRVSSDGNVGVGTAIPSSPIHVSRADNTFQMLLLDQVSDGAATDRNMIQLNNKGGIRFQFDNTAIGTSWRFQAAAGRKDVFEIAKVGTGAIELELDGSGNLTIQGALTQGSDINSKTDIENIDSDSILSRLDQLTISEWSYKTDPQGTRHIGPMAQEFFQVFSLGNDETKIAPADMASVAIASIQAQQKQIRTQELEIEELRKRLESLKELEARLHQIEVQHPYATVAL